MTTATCIHGYPMFQSCTLCKRDMVPADTFGNANPISDESIGQAFGRLGGRATLRKYGPEHFKKLSEKAIKVRQEKGQIKKPSLKLT